MLWVYWEPKKPRRDTESAYRLRQTFWSPFSVPAVGLHISDPAGLEGNSHGYDWAPNLDSSERFTLPNEADSIDQRLSATLSLPNQLRDQRLLSRLIRICQPFLGSVRLQGLQPSHSVAFHMLHWSRFPCASQRKSCWCSHLVGSFPSEYPSIYFSGLFQTGSTALGLWRAGFGSDSVTNSSARVGQVVFLL